MIRAVLFCLLLVACGTPQAEVMPPGQTIIRQDAYTRVILVEETGCVLLQTWDKYQWGTVQVDCP